MRSRVQRAVQMRAQSRVAAKDLTPSPPPARTARCTQAAHSARQCTLLRAAPYMLATWRSARKSSPRTAAVEGVRCCSNCSRSVENFVACADLELLEAVDSAPPDVVLTDIRMPPDHQDEGIQAAIRFRRTHPRPRSRRAQPIRRPAYALALIEGGSERRAYLLKDRVDDAVQLVGAIEIRMVPVGRSSTRRSRHWWVCQAERQLAARGVTPREIHVLRAMAEGRRTQRLPIVVAERSVERCTRSSRSGCRSRTRGPS